jgi:hypothetical protein
MQLRYKYTKESTSEVLQMYLLLFNMIQLWRIDAGG